MDFIRKDYYSQTEVLKKYKINSKTYQRLLVERNIEQVNRTIKQMDYSLVTIYVKIKDVESLGLVLREKKT